MRLLTTLLAFALLAAPALAEQPKLDPHLEAFAPLIGKTFRGEISRPGSDKTSIDILHWERILNGKALRVTHSLNEGQFGGESIYLWDTGAESLVYYYFSTEGFYTHGSAVMEADGSWSSHEFVEGAAGGVTEARSSMELREDGSLFARSEYKIDGEWKPGREATYHEAPDAEVIFR